MIEDTPMQIVLASTSPYRAQQLRDFGLEFTAKAPLFDEEGFKATKLSPSHLCRTLAFKKAESLKSTHPNDIIIGADQLVSFKKKVLGKPHTRENAIAMLQKMSGRTHRLITSLCVLHKNKIYSKTIIAKIRLRKLSREEVISYIYRDNPLDCAGSYKFERSGLSLVQSMSVSDPSSLTGLPLISLTRFLRKTGEPIPFINKR